MSDEPFTEQEMNEEGSFAEMLEQSMLGKTQLEPGQKIDATVLQIGDEWIFLDVGQKGEGVLDRVGDAAGAERVRTDHAPLLEWGAPGIKNVIRLGEVRS